MSETVRICIIGGGSANWSPVLLGDLAATPALRGVVVLHDHNHAAAVEMADLGTKLMAATGSAFTVAAVADQRAALTGADFVIVTITTGGLAAMRDDLELPARYGIVQTVGDTVGPGGLARALRNVPVFVALAQTMAAVCPAAWLLNLTNPMAPLVRAVSRTSSIKTVGLCHEMFGVRRMFATLVGARPDEVALQIAGTNHLTWVLSATVRGEDALARWRAFLAAGGTLPLTPPTEEHRLPFHDAWRLKRALFDRYGYLPAAGDRHLAEFFPYFLPDPPRDGDEPWVRPTTIAHRAAGSAAARARVRAWRDGTAPLPVGRSEEEVVDVIQALVTGAPYLMVANLPNQGQIDNLPRGAVVETRAAVMAGGIHPLSVGELPLPLLTTVQPHVFNHELIVEAALTGDRALFEQALLNDPLVRDFATVPALAADLVTAHRAYLPRFFPA